MVPWGGTCASQRGSMADTTGRTFICSVVFVDLVEYSKKSVAEQILLKETCNALIAEAIDAVPPDARIVLDTGDGAAITFLGDPEDALFVALKLRDSIEEALTSHSIGIGRHKANGHIRVGVNLGPVKIATNVNGGANIVGDGIAVAERIMGFALPGHMLVSRSFYEMVSRLSDDYGSLFRPDGQRTDPNGRVHELYLAGRDPTALQTAERGARERKKIASGDHAPLPKASVARGGPAPKAAGSTIPPAAPSSASSTLPPRTPTAETLAAVSTGQMQAPVIEPVAGATAGPHSFLEDRYKVGFIALLLTLSASFQGFLIWQKKSAPEPLAVAETTPVKPPEALPAPRQEPQAPTTPAKPSSAQPPAPKATVVEAPSKPAPPEPASKRPPEKEPAIQRPKDTSPSEKPKPDPIPEPPARKPAVDNVTKPAASEKPPVATTPSPTKPTSPPVSPPRKTEPAQPASLPLQLPPTAPVQPSQAPAPAPAPPVAAPIEPPKPAPSLLITKVSGATVEFPPEAVRAGVTSGYVRARVRIDANGVPADVSIVESRPNRVFDRAVKNTLSLWRFNPGADNRIYEAQIDFNR